MQEGGGDAVSVEGQLGDVARDGERVEDVGLAGLPHDAAVLQVREIEGAVYDGEVRARHIVGAEIEQRAQRGVHAGVPRRVHEDIAIRLFRKHGAHAVPRRFSAGGGSPVREAYLVSNVWLPAGPTVDARTAQQRRWTLGIGGK